MRSSISQTIDQGIGTTFDAHAMAGYRFLMRYYESVSKTINKLFLHWQRHCCCY